VRDALLVVDVMNDFEHDDGQDLLDSFASTYPLLSARLARPGPAMFR
jgi:hypothetical protein